MTPSECFLREQKEAFPPPGRGSEGGGRSSSRNFSLFFFPNPEKFSCYSGRIPLQHLLKGTEECYQQLSKIVNRYLWRLTFSRS